MNDDRMLKAWSEFIVGQKILPEVPQQIASSWLRSRLRLNPYQDVRLQQLSSYHLLAAQVSSFEMISVARPVMEDIFQYLDHANSAIVYVNNVGYILEILGHSDIIKKISRVGIMRGGLFSEDSLGTNAFSLALIERVPSQVKGAEHYLQQFHTFVESAAPIFDLGGTPRGALGIINFLDSPNLNTMSLAAIGARTIESQCQSDLLLEEQNMQFAQLNKILGSISEGVLVWNAEGKLTHINVAAEGIIGISGKKLVGSSYKDLFVSPNFIQEAIELRQPLVDIEAAFQAGDDHVVCILSMQFITQGDAVQSVIVTLRPENEVRKLLQHQLGVRSSSTLDDIVGISPKIREVRRLANVAANAQANVFLIGESGSGKNMLAGAIHNGGNRKEGPFVIFSCSDYVVDGILRELMGYENTRSGRRGRPSKFELAQGGTLYIKGVDFLPLEAQAALLNALGLGIICRLGSKRPIEVDTRVIASTSANIERLIVQGSFRADLYYRLSVFEIRVPPLRERMEDFPLLVERILGRFSKQMKRSLKASPDMIDALEKYSWPGNLQELEIVLERAVTNAGNSNMIGPLHLPEFIYYSSGNALFASSVPEAQTLEQTEHELILRTAKICKGNISEMSRVLGISRTTLWRKLKTYDISARAFKESVDGSGVVS